MAGADRMVGFVDAIGLGIANYFNFSDRSSRGAYWFWTLFVILITFGAMIVDRHFLTDGDSTVARNFIDLATFIPGISITVRRLHDIGKSGWWILLVFTIIGLIPLLYMMCVPGQRKTNDFGPDEEAGR